MTGDTVPESTVHKPSMPTGEVEILLFAIDRSRGVLIDLHDEYARHLGHPDILREASTLW